MIVLLDLNYTLIENSQVKMRPFTLQIENEVYRQWLVEALSQHTVVLLTARPDIHKEQTLASILNKTGWAPHRAYFNSYRLPPPAAKDRMMNDFVLPEFGHLPPSSFLAIESNPRSRQMFARRKIAAFPVLQWGECAALLQDTKGA